MEGRVSPFLRAGDPVVGLGRAAGLDAGQRGLHRAGRVILGEPGGDRVAAHPVALVGFHIDLATHPGASEGPGLLQALSRRIDRQGVGADFIVGRHGKGPNAVAPGNGLHQLAGVDIEPDRIGRQVHVLGHRVSGIERRDIAQLLVIQLEIDPLAGESEGILAGAFHAGTADEGAVIPGAGVQSQRVAPSLEVTAIDGDLSSAPDPVVALHPHAVRHDHVGLTSGTGGIASSDR